WVAPRAYGGGPHLRALAGRRQDDDHGGEAIRKHGESLTFFEVICYVAQAREGSRVLSRDRRPLANGAGVERRTRCLGARTAVARVHTARSSVWAAAPGCRCSHNP